MVTDDQRALQQLINTHKVTSIIMPLIEAVEINRRSGTIQGLNTSSLLKQVIEVGSELYQVLIDDDGIVETGLVSDKLFVALSMSLRNSIVLYNNPSLALMKDEMLSVFKDNIEFIQRYQNKFVAERSVNPEHTTETEAAKFKQDALGYVLPAFSRMFMPVYLFHTNLYTSGFIDEAKLAECNKEVFAYCIDVVEKLVERISKAQGKADVLFRANTLVMCADMLAYVIRDYHRKLIKNESVLKSYIDNPIQGIERLVPSLYANFKVLNDETEKALNLILGDGWRESA
tara:strand:- start:201 stop:1061 length:861 start_codon:yes stop_codon:yes gene_type:complete